jgi:glycosyltransferase involved in cell wall biosynthesis
MSDVTVIVATYGLSSWERWGDEAASSVKDVPVFRVHDAEATLAQVRNFALDVVDTEYVCFLDADDALAPGYFDRDLSADIVVTPLDGEFPRVNGHQHTCRSACLVSGNYIHIGAIARSQTLRDRGGFREHPAYEDWDLWLRCHYARATFANSPGPAYLTKQRGRGGRNSALPHSARALVRARIMRTAREG